MSSDKEKKVKIAEYFLKSFEEKSPFDYDILDSMFTELKHTISQITKN
jgi:bifunctional DNase/RNase